MTVRLVCHFVYDDFGAEQDPAYGRNGASPGAAAQPFLDFIADNGIRFDQYYSEAFCSPSRADHMSGRLTEDHGVGDIIEVDGDTPLLQSELTLAEVLKLAFGQNISTACIGKWHLGTNQVGGNVAPNRAGFDYFVGSVRNLTDFYNDQIIRQGEAVSSLGKYIPEMMADYAITWLRRFAGQRKLGYLYLPWHLPHNPFHRPPTYLYDDATWTCALPAPVSGSSSEIIPYHKAMVQAQDTLSLRVLNSIPASLLADTVILVSSDNGTTTEMLAHETYPTGEPYNGTHGKRSYLDPGCRVPAYAYSTSIINPGRTCSGLVQPCDWYTTTLALFGVDWGNLVAREWSRLSGVSPADRSVNISKVITTSSNITARTNILAGIFSPNGPNRGTSPGRRMVSDGNRKLLFTGTAQVAGAFYDYAQDPFELAPITSLSASQLASKTALETAWAAYYASLPELRL